MNIEIANRLVQLRKKNQLSQEALAEKLGISRQAVSKWERAEASPDTDNLIMLARLYNISLDELLRIEEEAANGTAAEALVAANAAEEPVMIIEEPRKIDYGFLRHFPIAAVTAAAYVILGAFWNLWHPGWLLLFLPPIWQSAFIALEKRDPIRFAYPVLAALIYLCAGLFAGLWHPGWIIFLTIPFYYPLAKYFKRLYRAQKSELDGILRGTRQE